MSSIATDEFNAIVGGRLAAVRASSGLTQMQFSDNIGLSDRAYSNYELGKREIPASVVRALYDAYGIDPLWLLAGPGNEPVRAVTRAIDLELLAKVIEVVTRELHAAGKIFSPPKYARFLVLAYRDAGERDAVAPARVRDLLSIA